MSLRGVKRRSNLSFGGAGDCFAALAMTISRPHVTEGSLEPTTKAPRMTESLLEQNRSRRLLWASGHGKMCYINGLCKDHNLEVVR